MNPVVPRLFFLFYNSPLVMLWAVCTPETFPLWTFGVRWFHLKQFVQPKEVKILLIKEKNTKNDNNYYYLFFYQMFVFLLSYTPLILSGPHWLLPDPWPFGREPNPRIGTATFNSPTVFTIDWFKLSPPRAASPIKCCLRIIIAYEFSGVHFADNLSVPLLVLRTFTHI